MSEAPLTLKSPEFLVQDRTIADPDTAEFIGTRYELTMLAAHAPPVPDWFMPDCETEPCSPRSRLRETMPNALAGRFLDGWIKLVEEGRRRSMREDAEMVTLSDREAKIDREIAAWCAASSEEWLCYVARRDTWRRLARDKAAMIQWPFVYAAMVLDARGDRDGVAGMGA